MARFRLEGGKWCTCPLEAAAQATVLELNFNLKLLLSYFSAQKDALSRCKKKSPCIFF